MNKEEAERLLWKFLEYLHNSGRLDEYMDYEPWTRVIEAFLEEVKLEDVSEG